MTADASQDAGFARCAVVRLSTIEFWERYSFYNMFALLPLFVSASTAKGGMGWSDGEALRFFGVYLLAVQTAPILGGWLADRWLDGYSALKLGAVLLLVGHALLTGPNVIPVIVHAVWGIPMRDLLIASNVPLGSFALPAGLPSALALPNLLVTLSFYGAVAFVAVGNGLFKPVLTVVVGRLPHANALERDRAFTIYFLFLNIGGLLSTLLGGFLADRYGWSWAFGAAAFGMGVSFFTTLFLARRYIRPFIIDRGAPLAVDARDPATVRGWRQSVAIVLIVFIAATVASYQSYGMISLFTAKLVDRTMGGFVIPPAWFTALNPITIMVLTPVFLRIWRGGGIGHDWSVTTKFAVGFVITAFGFASFYAATLQAHDGTLASPGWIMIVIVLLASVELLTAPAMNATITRLAPLHRQTFVVGLSSAAVGIGAWLSGRVGASAMETGVGNVVLMLIAGCLGVAAVMAGLRRWFAQYSV